MNKIKVEKLRKVFKTGEEELEIFNIEEVSFDSDKTYAIKGASGSGKSTFLQILAGLDSPSNGTVKISGEISKILLKKEELDIHKEKSSILNKLRRNHLGFIYQKNFLLKDLNVLDNLLIVKNDRKKALSLLNSVGLEMKNKSYYSELSGGERQRVSICRALMNSPDFIFADEPTGSLDFHNKENVWNLLIELRKIHGFGLIMVTHDNELADNCEVIYNLKEGLLIKEN